MAGSRPSHDSTSGDQLRSASSNRFELEPADGSVTNLPLRRVSTQSDSMPTWAMASHVRGSWSRIQRKRPGDVMATQSPPCSKIRRASPLLTRSSASADARESTLGHAQISRPAASYRTMPSRMLVAETAMMPSGPTPDRLIASRQQAAMSSQLRAVSKTWEPGTPGNAAWDHSRWAVAAGEPSAAKTIARQLPVPRSMARTWLTTRPRRPRRGRPGSRR